ncbi:unnamed protein product, partial [Medioppia subpectinata]
MGASGAGKTTLLNVLTARNLSKLSVKGVVLLNGQAVSGENMVSKSSYIEQHDLFHSLLTVREHLVFQSLLRMDTSFTRDQKSALVDQLLIKFNLSKCMDTQIGGDFEFKGISGGEMKRLSFASEILSNPSLFDEPTTGLDSFMAQNIVQTLKTMASEGRTIVCTIHQPSSQPSSQVFALFDHILLMADGRVAFMGTTETAKHFFSSLGFVCPKNCNLSDYYIKELGYGSSITSNNYEENRIKVISRMETPIINH